MKLARPIVVVSALSALLLGCPKKGGGAATDAGPGDASTDGGAGGDAGAAASGDDVRPVYPVDPNIPPNPIAQKLCAGLTEMPEKKRAACCQAQPGIVFTSECTRTLSAALQYKAVQLDEGAVDACVAAFEKTLDGCDWVGPFAPGPPEACHGIVKGLLAFGEKCRSTLECAGALRCRGVGPTTPGHCSAPSNNGEVCGGTVDALATYVRQNDVDKDHPECAAGRCIKHRCGPPAPENGDCQVTLDCAEGLQCIASASPPPRAKKGEHPAPARKCLRRPLPKEGEACPGGICAGDLGCVLNKCTARKPGGATCANDFECRGGCVQGKCGPRCDLR
jgi:hypothetical protein